MNISGIYKITSSVHPYRLYIGSSIDIPKRWKSHINALKSNRHHSDKLQRHYNKYGESDLSFSILKRCTPDKVLTHEQWYLDTLSLYFNTLKVAGNSTGREVSKETRRKISKSLTGNSTKRGFKMSKEQLVGYRKKRMKPILQYSKNGDFIKEWGGAVEIYDATGFSTGNICSCCKGVLKTAYNFKWKYKTINRH